MGFLHICITIFLLSFMSLAQAQRPDELVVSTEGEFYKLTVPVSRLELSFPKAEIIQIPLNIGGSTSNPRYFNFNDKGKGLVISGWFEPSSGYTGIKQFWEQELPSWEKSKLPAPTDVSIENFGNWEAVFYQQPIAYGVSSAHVRAHLVQAGTWVDLHISYTSRESYIANRGEIETFLKTIIVREK